MSHTLTEVDEFTETVVVPDGLDPGSQRSEAMTAIAQALANRTQNLKARADALDADAARKSQPNTFTQPNTFAQPVGATDIAASGTVRALWLTAQDITSDRDIDCARNYTYLPTGSPPALPARIMSLPLQWALGNGIWYDHTIGRIDFSTGVDFVPLIMPVRLPHGAVLEKVEFLVDQAGAVFSGYSVEYVPNYAAPGVARNEIFNGPASVVGAGVKVATISFSNRAVVSGNRYEVVLYPGNSGNDHVLDARVFFTDPGPRNH